MAWTTPKVSYATGDILPAADMNAIGANLAALNDQGADLASATTITITNGFHKVTGTTTIDNLTLPSGLKRVILWFTGAALVRHNGGGTGNVRLAGGVDFQAAAGSKLVFVTDGTTWEETSRAAAAGSSTVAEMDYKERTTTYSLTTAFAAVITGNTVAYSASDKYRLSFTCPEYDGPTVTVTAQFKRGSTVLGQLYLSFGNPNISQAITIVAYDRAPTTSSYAYSFEAKAATQNGSFTCGAGGAATLFPMTLHVSKV